MQVGNAQGLGADKRRVARVILGKRAINLSDARVDGGKARTQCLLGRRIAFVVRF